VSRARPYTQDCAPDGQVRDASGRARFNTCCGGNSDYQTFFSGHSTGTATMAGPTCGHHQQLPLYGGGFADLTPCLFMIAVSGATGVSRIVADRHWASDVIGGWGAGALAGYVLPSLLHYGFSKGMPSGAIEVAGLRSVPALQASAEVVLKAHFAGTRESPRRVVLATEP
jgi:hypothetical protein